MWPLGLISGWAEGWVLYLFPSGFHDLDRCHVLTVCCFCKKET